MKARPVIIARARLSSDRATATIRWCDGRRCSDALRVPLAALPDQPHDRHAAMLAIINEVSPPAGPEALCRASRWADAALRAIDKQEKAA